MGFFLRVRGAVTKQSFYNAPLKTLGNTRNEGTWKQFKIDYPAVYVCVVVSLTAIPFLPFFGPNIRLLLGIEDGYKKYPNMESKLTCFFNF